MDYLSWNNAIGERFFNSDRSGIRVFLYVTIAVVNDIGAAYDVDRDDFLAAVKTGPQWNSRHGQSICQQALQAYDDWRHRNLEYPPYLAYLALFSLADTVEVNGFSRASYYPGLRYVLGEEPAAGSYPSFDRMVELWRDLEVWSNQDKNGELGIFYADILGNRAYVGLPKAQTILTDNERHKLPLLFAENGFDPSSPPADSELSHLLAREMHHYLLPHTKDLLDNRSSEESAARDVLLATIMDELEDWDGTIPPKVELGEKTESSLGTLRIGMALDPTAKTVHFSLRCRSNREYPEEGLQLVRKDGAEPLYCYEDWQGWSTMLCEDESQIRMFDAAFLDWRDGLNLVDTEHSWRTSLSRRPARVMVSASQFGFDGFIEESQIPQNKPFYMLIHNKYIDTIQTWGTVCCKGFSEVQIHSGLPEDWRLFSIQRANSDEIIRNTLPFLAFPTLLRIRFIGGFKYRGNQYFAFGLPLIEVRGAPEPVELFCNDIPLKADCDTGLYSIPNEVCARRLIIEVRHNGDCIRTKSLYALELSAWLNTVTETQLNKFGNRSDCGTNESCFGIIIDGFEPPDLSLEVFLPPTDGNRIYFIGRNPGEIVECPRESISDDWKPVWAVIMKKGKGHAIYCGLDPSSEKPKGTQCKDHQRLRLWKDVLWHKRKRISIPSLPALKALWKDYKEVAHDIR